MDTRLIKHQFGFWQIANKPSPEELHRYYSDKYYQEGRGSYEIEYSPEELAYFRAKLRQRYAMLTRHLDRQNGSMLDVGCGEGYALAFFREQGWAVTGFDYSAAGVESKNPACKDVLLTGDVFELLDSAIETGASYDVIWLQNVLEHVLDPLELLVSLKSLVTPGGIAVITVPNDFSITQLGAIANQHIDSSFWVAPPDHLSYFDHKSLASVAYETGWKCLDMLGDFPIDWFLFHSGSNYVRDKALGKFAHKARVQIENLINEQALDGVLDFWSAAAKIGIGRDITAFLRPVRSI